MLDLLQSEVSSYSQDCLAVCREGNACVAAGLEDPLRLKLPSQCVPLEHCTIHPT